MVAAALIALLVTALEAFSMMVPAFVPCTMMMTALMAFPVMMAVVVASGIGIILQRILCQSLRGCVGRTGNAAVEPDPRLGQCVLRTHADAAANQRVHLRGFQETGQRPVSAAVSGHDLLRDDLSIFHVIELELLRVAEMLEDLSVFVSYRNSHRIQSFLHDVFHSLIIKPVVSASDQEALSIHQRISHFPPCALVGSRNSCAGNSHPFGTLLLGQAFAVKKPDCLKLIQAQHDGLFV